MVSHSEWAMGIARKDPNNYAMPIKDKKICGVLNRALAWSRSSPPDEISCLAARCSAHRSFFVNDSYL